MRGSNSLQAILNIKAALDISFILSNLIEFTYLHSDTGEQIDTVTMDFGA